jgi:glycosyltransferase involved in cell wall biosynthesis
MQTVLVFASNLLRLSETFIKEQMLALQHWRGVLVGLRQLQELSLEGLDVRILRPNDRTLLERAHWRLNKSIGTVPGSVIRSLKREEASLVHAHFGVEAIDAWPIARALDVPMLVTLHGYDINIHPEWWEAGHRGRTLRRYPARLRELGKHPRVHFVAVSQAIRRRAVAFGIPESKISTRYIGVDRSKFSPGGRPIVERDRRVLFVGRLVEKKGCEYLIRAFSKVQEAVPDASLIIGGTGPLQGNLQEIARNLNVSAQFLGPLSSSNVQHELSLARVFCLPSVTAADGDAEGFGIVLLEAQASGVPVVTSAMGGAKEGIQEGITGFAFPEGDTNSLSSRLIELLTNDAVAASLAAAGPDFVAGRFDLFRCTEKLERLYDRVSAHAPIPSPTHALTGAPIRDMQ